MPLNPDGTYTIPVSEKSGNLIQILKGVSIKGVPLLPKHLYNGNGTMTVTKEMLAYLAANKYDITKFEPAAPPTSAIPVAPTTTIPVEPSITTIPVVPTTTVTPEIINDSGSAVLDDDHKKDGGFIGQSGIIQGPGTGKSDSIKTNYEGGALVVPVEKVAWAKEIYKKYIGDKIETAKPAQGGTPVRVSNGEFMFTPDDIQLLLHKGADLSPILPDHYNTTNTGAEGMIVDYSALPDVGEKVHNIDYDSLPDVGESLKKKGQLPSLSPFISPANSTDGSRVSAYQPENSVSEAPSISGTNNQIPISPAGDIGVTSGETTTGGKPQSKEYLTVDEIKKKGEKPTFGNYVASAIVNTGEYVGEHANQIYQGAKQLNNVISSEETIPMQQPAQAPTPITDQFKKSASDALDVLQGTANMAFGALSFTPVGAGFNVAAETIVPESVNKWLFSPAHSIAEKFGYESKEGTLEEKALSVGDIVGSLIAMHGVGEGVDKIGEKIKKKEPLNMQEADQVAKAVVDATPEDLQKAVEENKDKLAPQFSTENKVVDVIEKLKNGDNVQKDIASLPNDKQRFDSVVDLSQQAGQLDETNATALKQNFDAMQQAREKVVPEHKDNPEIVSLVAEKTNLETAKKNIDDSFHPEINAKIDEIKAKINEITNPIKPQENAKATGEPIDVGSSQQGLEQGTKGRLRVRDTEKDRVEAQSGEIAPLPHTETDFQSQERQVEERFKKDLEDNYDFYKAKYKQEHGNVFNTDLAREFSKDYEKNKEQMSNATQIPARDFVNKLYKEELNTSAPEGKQNAVTFMSGGSGVGKTISIKDFPTRSQLIVDTNFSNFDRSKADIEEALSHGKKVKIRFIYRDPHESFLNGIVPRSKIEGRTVSYEISTAIHEKSLETIKKLTEYYKDNPDVKIRYYDNNGLEGQSKEVSFNSIKNIKFDKQQINKNLKDELEKQHQTGQLTESQYKGLTEGKEVGGNDGQGNSRVGSEGGRNVSEISKRGSNKEHDSRETSTMAQGSRRGISENIGQGISEGSTKGLIPTAEEVAKNLEAKKKDLLSSLGEKKIDPKKESGEIIQSKILPIRETFRAVFKPISKIQDKVFDTAVSQFENWAAKGIQSWNISQNIIKRDIGQFLTSWSNGLPRTSAQLTDYLKYKGGVALAKENMSKNITNLRKLIDNNLESLARVHEAMDPEFYGGENPAYQPVAYESLSDQEKQLYDVLRKTNDYVHDYTYAMGFISPETYTKYMGKYTPRMYEPYEVPEDVQQALEEGSQNVHNKMDLSFLKARKEVDEYKYNTILKDPIYASAKRMMQTEVNASIKGYIDKIVANPKLISEGPQKGFTQLNGKGYGDLNGKYLANYIAEDFKGYFFANKVFDLLYDASKIYDRTQLRQFIKKFHTVYSPSVQLGNLSSNFVFGFLSGIDPVTMGSKMIEAGKEVSAKGPVYDLLLKNGILGSDVITGDLIPLTKKTQGALAEKPMGGLAKVDEAISNLYKGTDDVSKTAAFLSLKSYGYSDAESIKKVYEGFQNYATVGKVWDLASKTLVFGNAFIKFQADLQRILKNAALKRPLSTSMFLGSIYAIGNILSDLSGESDEEKKLREQRQFIPKIKLGFTDLPLNFMTPVGEVNVARYLSPYYIYDTGDSQNSIESYSKLLPFKLQTIENAEKGTSSITISPDDPFLGVWYAAFVKDRDFRGKSIQDPESSKYRVSGATSSEKALNSINYVMRSQFPYYSNAQDMYLANTYGTDFYGRDRNGWQTIVNNFVKVENFSEGKYQDVAEKKIKSIEYNITTLEGSSKDIDNTIEKEIEKLDGKLEKGLITQKQYDISVQELTDNQVKRKAVILEKIADRQKEFNDFLNEYRDFLPADIEEKELAPQE